MPKISAPTGRMANVPVTDSTICALLTWKCAASVSNRKMTTKKSKASSVQPRKPADIACQRSEVDRTFSALIVLSKLTDKVDSEQWSVDSGALASPGVASGFTIHSPQSTCASRHGAANQQTSQPEGAFRRPCHRGSHLHGRNHSGPRPEDLCPGPASLFRRSGDQRCGDVCVPRRPS